MRQKGSYYVNRHSCFLLQYHLVLVTKYRKKVITGACRDRVLALTHEYFKRKGYPVLEVEACPDHVHILFEAPPNEKLSELVNGFKTFISRKIRREFEEYLRQFYWEPLFWSDSYFIATVSERTTQAVKDYIANHDF